MNEALPAGRRPFILERLVRSVRVLVREGLADASLLAPAPKGGGARKPPARRAMEIAAAYASGRPGATPAKIGAELVRMKAMPPRGGQAWAPSSVKALLNRARE